MNPLLISLLGVILVPLFLSSWRASLLGLGCQGAFMALLLLRLAQPLQPPGDWLALLDLAGIRGLLAPLALYGVLRRQNVGARNDAIPPDVLSWTVAIGMVLMSFSFAETLVKAPGEQQTLVAVASSGLLLGFLVLSTRADPLSQVLGALRVENAIALFELGGDRRDPHVFVQLGQLGIFVATVAFFARYLGTLGATRAVSAGTFGIDEEGPTL